MDAPLVYSLSRPGTAGPPCAERINLKASKREAVLKIRSPTFGGLPRRRPLVDDEVDRPGV